MVNLTDTKKPCITPVWKKRFPIVKMKIWTPLEDYVYTYADRMRIERMRLVARWRAGGEPRPSARPSYTKYTCGIEKKKKRPTASAVAAAYGRLDGIKRTSEGAGTTKAIQEKDTRRDNPC